MTGSSSSEESQGSPGRPTRAPAETLVSTSRNTSRLLDIVIFLLAVSGHPNTVCDAIVGPAPPL